MAKQFVGQEYMAATNGKGLQQESKGHRILTRTTVTCSTIITLASVFVVIFCLIFALCPVDGTSMMTTLNASGDPNQRDQVVTCTVGQPKNGDIIIMKLYIQNTRYADYWYAAQGDADALTRLREKEPFITEKDAIAEVEKLGSDPKGFINKDKMGSYELIIKRLIAQGGDRISMRQEGANYYLYLNGVKLEENYLDPLVAQHDAMNFKQLWQVLNQSGTNDYLRDWKTTDLNKILVPNTDQAGAGIPSDYMLVIPENHYFVLGDNRGGNVTAYNYSWDSCYWGPLPTENYYSYCVDKLEENISLPQYLWNKFVYYVGFGWAWQK